MTSPRKDRFPIVIVIIVLIAVFLTVFGFAVFSRVLHREAIVDDNSIHYAGQKVPISENVDKNTYTEEDFTTTEDGRVTDVTGEKAIGIDVSSHQGEIDWAAVAGDGIEFAILRAGYRGSTEGMLYPDETFAANAAGAAENGIDIGVYFFSQATDTEEATAEAAYVLSMIEENDVDVTYPVVFDWEMDYSSNARVNGVSRDTVTKCAAAFCQKIRGAGYTPCIYFNTVTGYLVYDLDQLSDYDFWLAEYNDKPSFYYGFQLWQNSCTGTVAGIDCDVDMDMAMKKYTP